MAVVPSQRVDLRVADVLLDRIVLQEARAAERLERLGQFGVRLLRADALDDRQQQVVDLQRQFGVDTVNHLGDGRVLVARGVQVQRAQTFGVGLLSHQAATDVRVVRDAHPRRGLVGHLRHVGALDAALGVFQRVQVTRRQRGDGFGADHHAGLLDDVEHLRNAVVNFADEPALGGYAVHAEDNSQVAETFSPILCSTLVTRHRYARPVRPSRSRRGTRDEEQ